MTKKDSWEEVKVELKKRGFSDYQIIKIYEAMAEVRANHGVSYLKL